MTTTVAELLVDVKGRSTNASDMLRKLEAELVRTHGVASQTADTLAGKVVAAESRAAREAEQLTQAQVRLRLASGDVAGAIRLVETSLIGLEKGSLAAVRGETQLLQLQSRLATESKGVQSAFQGLGSAFGQFGVAFGAGALLKGAVDLGTMGAAANSSRDSFNNLAQAAGQAGPALLASIKAAASGTVSEAQIIQSANTGLLLVGSKLATELPKLLQIARASAKATGQDIGFLFNSLVLGISRGSPKIIDNAGITLDATAAFELYAASIHKSVDALTDQERQQATLNAVVAAGDDIVKKVGLSTDDAATKIARATASVDDFKSALGQRLAPVVATVAEGLSNLLGKGDLFAGARGGADQAQATILKQAGSYEDYVRRIGAANQQLHDQLAATDPAFAALARGLQTLTPLQFAYAESLVHTGVSQADAVAKAQQYESMFAGLAVFQDAARASTDISAGALDHLSNSIVNVATTIPGSEDAINALAIAFLNGTLSGDVFQFNLDQMAAGHQRNAQAALQSAAAEAFRAEEHRGGTQATQEGTSALDAFNTTLGTNAVQADIAKAQSSLLASEQERLYAAAQAAAGGSDSLSAAASRLAAQFQLPIDKARELISLLGQIGQQSHIQMVSENRDDLRNARTNAAAPKPLDAAFLADQARRADDLRQANIALANAQGNTAKSIALMRQEQAQYNKGSAEYLQLEAKILSAEKSGRGGGRAKAAGAPKLSDQQKLNTALLADQEKADTRFEELELKHAKKLLDINRETAEKLQAAQRDFHQNQLDGSLGFYANLGNITDNGLQKALSAQYEAAVLEAQRIAQEKGPDAGQAFLDAAAKAIQDEGKLQEEIAKATAEGDSGRAEFLTGLLAKQKAADEQRLADIRASGSAIETERQKQIESENLAYEEQGGKIADTADRAAQAKILAAQRSGKAIEAENLLLERQAGLYDRIGSGRSGTAGAATTPAASTVGTAPTMPAPTDLAALLAAYREVGDKIVAAIASASGDQVRATQSVQSAVAGRAFS